MKKEEKSGGLKKMEFNFWRNLRDYVREFKCGNVILRGQFIRETTEDLGGNYKILSSTYRNWLQRAGYLEGDGIGNCKKVKQLPKNMSLRQLKKEANVKL